MNVCIFSGRIAAAPVLTHHGEVTVCRLRVITNEYAGQNKDERTVAMQFTAFNKRAEFIAKNFSKGDGAFIQYRIENNDRPDPKNSGEMIYGYNFIIEEIDFGAPGPEKRAMLAKRQAGQASQGSGDDYDEEPGRFPPL